MFLSPLGKERANSSEHVPNGSDVHPSRFRETRAGNGVSQSQLTPHASVATPNVVWDHSKIANLLSSEADKLSGNDVSRPLAGDAQQELVVGEAGDALEAEADRVADQVMRRPVPESLSRVAPLTISHDRTDAARAKKVTSSIGVDRAQDQTLANAQLVLASAGQPLDVAERTFFEQRFGHDFSGVRVHHDGAAATSAKAMGAQAYTVGRDLVFAEGRYSPSSAAGRHLLAHELTHTMQQKDTQGPLLRRKLEVGAGLKLNTLGFVTTKAGNVYSCPATVKNSLSNEIFTALLSSPRIFKIAGTTDAQVDSNFAKHSAARVGIVDFASKKKYSFAAGVAFRMNPAFWIVDATGFRPKPGVDRDAAIQDLNLHPREYAIACLAATQLTMEGGGKSVLKDDPGASNDWIPGDWGYITNTKFPPNGRSGLEGENIIYTGKDLFWGHFGPGIEYKLLSEWFDQVKSWHNGARIEDQRIGPTIGLM